MAETRKTINDAGMGAAAKMGLQLYEQASRGSGRTYRMIMALQPGAVVLSRDNGDWLRHMIRDLRGGDFDCKVISCKATKAGVYEAMHRHRIKPPVAMDHFVVLGLYQEALDGLAKELASLGAPEHSFGEIQGAPPPAAFFGGRFHG